MAKPQPRTFAHEPFFQLKKVISEYFQIDSHSLSSLVKTDEDGINLELRQGKMEVLSGVYLNPIRPLKVEFYYNKTFRHTEDFEKQGSWTVKMRPDYTLAIWPSDLSIEKAEEENLIVYIHFDAKYRLKELLWDNPTIEEMPTVEDKELRLFYKQADILKMHAYKDAIHRTAGAYVLYPGDINKEFKGFHEVIPGLGAFAIKPGDADSTKALQDFIHRVVEHFLNRTTMRERMTTHKHLVYEDKKR